MKKYLVIILVMSIVTMVGAELQIFGDDTNKVINLGELLESFLDLSDTPSSYGTAGLCVKVNSSQTPPIYFGSCSNVTAEAGNADGNASSICGDNEVLLGQDATFCVNLNDTIDDRDTDTTIGNCSGDQSCANVLYNSDLPLENQTISHCDNITGSDFDICTNPNTDTNFSSCGDGEYGDGDENCYSINDTIDLRTASTTYNASSITTIEGTLDAGNLASIQAIDGDWYNVSEDAGGSPLLVEVNFSGIASFDSILIRMQYSGGLGHEIEIQSWNFDDGAWELHSEVTDQSTMVELVIPVLDSTDHVSGGEAVVRFDHVQNGVAIHDLFIDYVALQEGFTSITNANHDSLSGRDDVENHPWALPRSGEKNMTGNLFGDLGINATFDWFFGNINWSDVQNVPSDISDGDNDTLDGTGGWTNTSTETNTSLVVNANTNLTVADSLELFNEIRFTSIAGTIFASGNGILSFAATGDTNYLALTSGNTGQPVQIASIGGDANIDMLFNPKGTGSIIVDTNTAFKFRDSDINISSPADGEQLQEADSEWKSQVGDNYVLINDTGVFIQG